MVIQSNMPVAGVISAWPITEKIFVKHGINPALNKALAQVFEGSDLQLLLQELNNSINSSDMTCIEGG